MVTFSSLGTVAVERLHQSIKAAPELQESAPGLTADLLPHDELSTLLRRDFLDLVNRLAASPEDLGRLRALSATIDHAVNTNPALRAELEKCLRETQHPAIVNLTVLGPRDRLADKHIVPPFRNSLRVALAMRGGVSLAVWIGGCVAELDILRQIRLHQEADGSITAYFVTGENYPDDAGGTSPMNGASPPVLARAQGYAILMAKAGYDQVEFDILAGASAGGLNSVLYSVAQRAGVSPSGVVLDMWQKSGGLQQLLRPPQWKRVDSMLSGDDYLYPELRQALTKTYKNQENHPDLVAEHVTVDLAATIIDSESSRDPNAQEGRGSFHFDGVATNRLSNQIPAASEPVTITQAQPPETADAHLARLAYAARATSSFPGAFEPASIHSTSGGSALDDSQFPNMRFAFGAHRVVGPVQEEVSFRVVDGGVFDNIPIGRALAATRTRASTLPADRALIYLDPDVPPVASHGRRRNEQLSHFIDAVSASVLRLKRRESLDAEVGNLTDYDNVLWLHKGREEAMARVMSANWSSVSREQRRAAYIRYRSTSDMAILTWLLGTPEQWQTTSTAPVRERFTAMSSESMEGLDTTLIDHDDRASRQPTDSRVHCAVLQDPQALLEASQCAFAWLRYLEEGSDVPTTATFESEQAFLRKHIYDILGRATQQRDLAFLRVLRARKGSKNGEVHADIVNAWRTSCPSSEVLATSWAALDVCVLKLLGLSQAHVSEYREESPWWQLAHSVNASCDAHLFEATDLAPAMAAAGIPPIVSRIHYWRIGSDEPPASVKDYELLLKGDRRQRVSTALLHPELNSAAIRGLVDPMTDSLSSQAKLAGNDLANFSGFLSKEWRTNDWWWGRMDAASGIAKFLERRPLESVAHIAEVDDQPFSDGPRNTFPWGSRDRVQWLQDRVLEQQFGAATSSLAQRRDWRRSIHGGADNVADLGQGYRVALISRGMRILWRAVLPKSGVRVWLVTLLHALLSALLVLIPALADLARLALITATAISVLWIAGGPLDSSRSPALDPWWWLAIPVLVYGAAAMLGLRRWKATMNAADSAPERRRKREYSQYRRRAALKAVAGALAGTAIFVPFALAWWQERTTVWVLLLLTLVAFVPLTYSWASTLPGTARRKGAVRTTTFLLTALALVLAVPLIPAISEFMFPVDRMLIYPAGFAVITVLLLVDWQKWWAWMLTAAVSVAPLVLVVWLLGLQQEQLIQGSWRVWWVVVALALWGVVVWWLPDGFKSWLREPADKVLSQP